MKRIILAFDSFKGSASSLQLAEAAKVAIHNEFPFCKVIHFPIADGGEGTTDAICLNLNAERVSCIAHNPLMEPIEVSYGVLNNGTTAVMEVAMASGLTLIDDSLRNPMLTTSYGSGEMILDALKRGCREFVIGLGGSATNDAGIGLLTALGIRFLDAEGGELDPIGESLVQIVQIDDSMIHPLLKEATFILACDVANPLYGRMGAAHIYAAQKGATNKQISLLDQGLRNFASVVKEYTGKDIAELSGAGAAGGIGGGLLAFLNAKLKNGIDVVLDTVQIKEFLKDTVDLILTGEGSIDKQTTMGKALGGLLTIAQENNIPIIALTGDVKESLLLTDAGFTAVLPIQPYPVSLKTAMTPEFTLQNINRTVTQLVRIIKRFSL